MKKRIGYAGLLALLFLLLCVTGGCKGQEAQEAAAQITELVSSPGNLQFTFPEGWTVKSNSEEGQKEGASAVHYEFVAEDSLTGSGIAVIYEDLHRIQGGNLIRMEDYLTAFQENLKLSGDYRYSCGEVSLTELYGETYYTFSARVEEPQLTQQFYLRRIEDTVMMMTFTVVGEDSLENLLEYGRSL